MGPELDVLEGLLRLGLAALLAGVVGFERELKDQEAGLRTHMLVGTGAALFVLTGNFAWSELDFGNGPGVVLDPSRVVAYVITGIGFLGGGTILKHGLTVKGLTTAASLWVVAAIGASVAGGLYTWSVATTAIVLLFLWPLQRVSQLAGLRSEQHRVSVDLTEPVTVAALADAVERHGATVTSASVQDEAGERHVDLVLSNVTAPDLPALVDGLLVVDGVRAASWVR